MRLFHSSNTTRPHPVGNTKRTAPATRSATERFADASPPTRAPARSWLDQFRFTVTTKGGPLPCNAQPKMFQVKAGIARHGPGELEQSLAPFLSVVAPPESSATQCEPRRLTKPATRWL